MNARERAIFRIYKESIQLFRDHGFDDTSVRKIAEKAETSASMVNHYFGSKDQLGSEVLFIIASYSYSGVLEYLSLEENPVLYDLTLNRIFFKYLFTNGYEKFYRDSLKYDFFFRFLDLKPTKLAESLCKHYKFEYTSDEALLYCRYIPYMLEKTLILKKEEGYFSSIDYDSIPSMVSEMAMGHFILEKEVKQYEEEACNICNHVLPTLSSTIPDEFIENFILKRNIDEISV